MRGMVMRLLQQLAVLGFREVFGERADALLAFAENQLGDGSQRLSRALQTASDRAWRTLELALAGDSFWDRCRRFFVPREEATLGRQVQAFLESVPTPELRGTPDEFRRQCLLQLHAARQSGLLG